VKRQAFIYLILCGFLGCKKQAPLIWEEASVQAKGKDHEVKIKGAEVCKVGKKSTVEIRLLPKSGYKISVGGKYPFPFKLKIKASKGIKFLKTKLLSKDALILSPQKLIFKVAFFPYKKGTYPILFSFDYAICRKKGRMFCIPYFNQLFKWKVKVE
jgi:hypothetical protein